MKNLKLKAFLVVLGLAFLVGGCGKKEDEKTEIKNVTVSEEKKEDRLSTLPVEENVEESKKEEADRSLLSGLPIEKSYVGKRPFAYMFNNIKFAYPQTGTGKASIIYEILAEGGITRLMGLFDYMEGDRIGSARSARHYYVDFAHEFDAFFIHFGQTKYAINEIKKLGVDTLSGLSSEGSIVFYRDPSIKAPHNAFASAEGIKKAVEKKAYRTELKKGISAHFNFSYNEEVELKAPTSFEANYVSVPFSAYMTPHFVYGNDEYTRFAFGTKHIDKEDNRPLSFKNLFIQLVNEYNIDKNGYQTMDLIGFSGKAFYITKGKAQPVFWKKEKADSKTKFYYDEAFKEEVLVNTGKTYYAVLPLTAVEKIKWKE